MRTFITAMSLDSLKFIIPFLLGAFIWSSFGVFGLMATVMSLLLINFISQVWKKKNRKVKKKGTK